MHKRILTAIPLILLVLLILFYTPPAVFTALSALVFLYGALEWSRLIGFHSKGQLIYFLVTAASFALAGLINALTILILSCLWWLMVPFLLWRFHLKQQNTPAENHEKTWFTTTHLHAVTGVLTLLSAWLSLNVLRLHEAGRWLVLCNLLIVWAADSSAYFVGKKWGKHRLAPTISPNKTLEGLGAALLASLIVAYGQASFLNLSPMLSFKFALLGLVAGTFCVIGDLYESMMKRIYNVKDSGTIFPGHGGLLDRIDGLLAATPFFTLGTVWLTLT